MAAAILDRILNAEGSKYPNDFTKIIELMGGSNSVGSNGEDFVWRAYNYGKKAHQGQLRKSGEPYFTHCVEVATILAEMKLDPVTISAALLHDVIEDTSFDFDDVSKDFGKKTAQIVSDVTKETRLPKIQQERNYLKQLSDSSWQSKVVKLADILANISDLKNSGFSKKEKTTKTISFYGGIHQNQER